MGLEWTEQDIRALKLKNSPRRGIWDIKKLPILLPMGLFHDENTNNRGFESLSLRKIIVNLIISADSKKVY